MGRNVSGRLKRRAAMDRPSPWLGLTTVLAILASGCASQGPPELAAEEVYPDEINGAPVWILEGCREYWDDEDARVCGVGSARIGNSMELARQKAGARARVEISRTLETKVRNMVKDYQEQVTDGSSEMDAEQFTSTTVALSRSTLNGTAQRATWISGSGQLYMLSALDVDAFNNSVREMDEMSDRLRGFIESRSRRSFRELDEAMDDY